MVGFAKCLILKNHYFYPQITVQNFISGRDLPGLEKFPVGASGGVPEGLAGRFPVVRNQEE